MDIFLSAAKDKKQTNKTSKQINKKQTNGQEKQTRNLLYYQHNVDRKK